MANGAPLGGTTTEVLMDIWREVLEKKDIDSNASFLDQGGQSLLAVRISNHIRNRFGVDIPLWFLFSDEGSIDNIAQIIDEES